MTEAAGPSLSTVTWDRAIAQLTRAGETYELESIEVAGQILRAFKNAPASLRALFESTASDMPFIVFEDERYTFIEAWRAAGRIGHVLVHRYGVAKGDRVSIAMRNFPEWILAFNAVTSIGAIAVAMNAFWLPEEMAYALTDSGAKVLIADQERVDRLGQLPASPDVAVISVRSAQRGDNVSDLQDLMAAAGDVDMPPVDISPDDPAILFYTSGSTGHPKGVISSHRNVISALLSWELDVQAAMLTSSLASTTPDPQPSMLLTVPLFHVTGSHAVHLSSYRAQRKIVSMRRWDPEAAAELIEREQISRIIAPAAITGDLVRVAQHSGRDLSSLLTVGGGGAPRAPEQVRQIGAAFTSAVPTTGWGMTETNAIGAGVIGLDYLHRPASSGRSSSVLDLKIIDEAGTALPAGQRGELMVRGVSVFRGYWNRPDANAEAFSDGWFHTGDVAYLDEEGFLFIVDRIKDMIIRGGENIGCGQVESAMLAHPLVHEASAYGLPDERLGEEVGATYFGAPELDPDSLRNYLALHLAQFAVPRFLFAATGPLPRIAAGKIDKRALRAEAIKALSEA